MKNYEFIQKVLTPEELCNHQAKLQECQRIHCEQCPYGYDGQETCPGIGYYAWLMSDLDVKWFKHEIAKNEQMMTFKHWLLWRWLLWQEWKEEEGDDEAIVHGPDTEIRSLSEEDLRKKYHGKLFEYERDKALIVSHHEIRKFEDAMKASHNVKNQKDAEEFAIIISWYYFLETGLKKGNIPNETQCV